jgi:hypothetical protein
MWSLPANLNGLHAVEEKCRTEAIALVARYPDLQEQLALIERAMDALIVVSRRRTENEDEETIRLLGLRLLNDCAAALKLLLGGYAQAAAMALRDVLETGFLVAYLTAEPNRIPQWRSADDRSLETDFAPAQIRKAFDDSDGFKSGRQAARSAVVCAMAIHPTFRGFRLLAPEGHGLQGGPFTDRRIFASLLKEMTLIVCATVPPVIQFFTDELKAAHRVSNR